MTLDDVKALCEMVVQFELESLECEGVKITKKLHRVAPVEHTTSGEVIPPRPEPTDEDVMMFSTYERRLTVEDLAKMGERTRGVMLEPTEPEH